MNQIYLDHNATTMMEQSAQRALLFYSSSASDPLSNFGNPSSTHWAGRKVKAAVDEARESLASALGVEDPESLCFTGSATESINMALKGFFFQQSSEKRKVRLITSAVEHEATLETARFLEACGATLTILPVGEQGELDLGALEKALRARSADEAVLVSLMAANNETGVVFPWRKARELSHVYGAVFHLDGVQGPGKLSGFSLKDQPVDLASFSAHKIGGPKGVGVLMVRRGVKLISLLHGGAQERKRRAGTLNVPGIAGFGAAALALKDRDLNRINELRLRMERLVLERISGTSIQGSKAERLVNTSNFLFEAVRGEGLVIGLDLEGFAVSSGSACNSGSIIPSHVLLAMGFDKAAAQSAVRVSLGPQNSEEEIDLFVSALEKVVGRIRALPYSKRQG